MYIVAEPRVSALLTFNNISILRKLRTGGYYDDDGRKRSDSHKTVFDPLEYFLLITPFLCQAKHESLAIQNKQSLFHFQARL